MSGSVRNPYPDFDTVPPVLRGAAERHWQDLEGSLSGLGGEDGRWLAALPRVFAASEFVARTCAAHPAVLRGLLESGDLLRAYVPGETARRVREALAGVQTEAELKQALRAVRRREMLRLAFRDLAGWADFFEVTAAVCELAEACLEETLARLRVWAEVRFGTPRGAHGPAAFVVLGLGKLGGEELNFSSDIDLVFAYSEDGDTSGPESVSNHEFFVRLGQQLINALSQATGDGIVFRVDMRLRPNGASGPLALSFDAMEQYYQMHGREWERYALIKARPCAGDRREGDELLARLRPFVFRKYLDYGAIEAIRGMKLLIEREVARKGLRDNIKLGPGGIREIEFIAQALQLIRGGREPPLQVRACLPALARLAEAGHLAPEAHKALADAYLFLRNTEHRLQEAHDRQVHMLPADERERVRLAFAMGFGEWQSFYDALERHRQRVQEHFSMMFAAPPGEVVCQEEAGLTGVWLRTADVDKALESLRRAGYRRPEEVLRLLEGLRTGDAYSAFSSEGRTRMDRLMPRLLAAAGGAAEPETTLARLVNLLEAIGRRSAYLALLADNPAVLSQLVALSGASPWIANWIARHPILLDELLDPRALYAPLDRAALEAELGRRLGGIPEDDFELQMEVLREFRHGHVLRVAAADIGPGLPPEETGRRLAVVAEVVIGASLALAEAALVKRYGPPSCPNRDIRPGFAVIGYGKLGSRELGYASDLDMIFIYEGCPDGTTAGPKSMANEEYFARLGQRLIHILTTRTPGGILYEVDMRLRPSGKSGPLVTSLEAFRAYQHERAWTWEHQALVRARPVAGTPELMQGFAQVRREILCLARDPEKLRRDILEMRRKMAGTHKGAAEAAFDPKHDRGGIVDIEFMVQYAVLRWAHEHPVLTRHTDNIGILSDLEAEGLLKPATARSLADAYRRYLSLEHHLKLMERACVERAELGDLPDRVQRIWDEVFEQSSEK